MKKPLNVLAGILAILAITIVPAKAISVIDFGTGVIPSGANPGTISFDGTDYTGTDIFIGALNVWEDDSHTGGYIADAVLNFSTKQDTIEIFGSVADLDITNNLLLSGSFVTFSKSSANPYMIFFQARGVDTKSVQLLDALGIPVETQFEFFGFSIGGNWAGTGGVYTANSTDIVNTSVGVPEPGTLLLLGSGLLGIGLMRRRFENRG